MPTLATALALNWRLQAASIVTLYNPNSQDLFHIKTEGNQIVVKVSSAGVVTLNPSTHTNPLFGSFAAYNAAAATVAAYFASAFPLNPNKLDIFQLFSGNGGVVTFHIDYLGVSYTP